jgi:hypothetical protein
MGPAAAAMATSALNATPAALHMALLPSERQSQNNRTGKYAGACKEQCKHNPRVNPTGNSNIHAIAKEHNFSTPTRKTSQTTANPADVDARVPLSRHLDRLHHHKPEFQERSKQQRLCYEVARNIFLDARMHPAAGSQRPRLRVWSGSGYNARHSRRLGRRGKPTSTTSPSLSLSLSLSGGLTKARTHTDRR